MCAVMMRQCRPEHEGADFILQASVQLLLAGLVGLYFWRGRAGRVLTPDGYRCSRADDRRQLSYGCLSYTATPSGMEYQSCFSLTQTCAVGLMMLVSDKVEGLSLIFSGSSGLK